MTLTFVVLLAVLAGAAVAHLAVSIAVNEQLKDLEAYTMTVIDRLGKLQPYDDGGVITPLSELED